MRRLLFIVAIAAAVLAIDGTAARAGPLGRLGCDGAASSPADGSYSVRPVRRGLRRLFCRRS